MKPITPDYDRESPVRRTPLERAQQKQIAELTAETNHLKAKIKMERVRHTRLENALSTYQSIIERQLQEQREAFRTLGKELLPSPMESN